MRSFSLFPKLALLIAFVFIIHTTAFADNSIYVISHDSYLRSFLISDNNLVFQKQVTTTPHGFGGIDITIDNTAKVLFITYEYSPSQYSGGNIIELYNATNLEHLDVLTVGPVGIDLTGLAYDAIHSRLYASDRNSDDLYVFDWNAASLTLTPDPCNPIQLGGGISNACGVAFDDNILYVSDYHYVTGETVPPQSSLVYKYDVTDNFNYLGTEDMDEGIVGIAQDPANDFLYGGAYGYPTANYNYLVKQDSDANSVIVKDISTNATGLAVDPDTGLVCISSYRYDPCSATAGSVELYDTSGWTSDPNQSVTYTAIYNSTNDDNVLISNLAGLTVGGPYKSSIMGLSATSDANESCVYPIGYGDPCYIEYTICYSGGEQGNQTGTFLTAYLPNGTWPVDSNDIHFSWGDQTFVWDLGTVAEDANDCVSFEVYVLPYVEPLGEITLEIKLESDSSYTTESTTTQVCCWGGDIIYVDQAVSDENVHIGVSWQCAYADLQDALNRAGQGCGDEIWVAKGTYIPGSTSGSKFTVPNGVELYGGFVGNETSLTQRNYINNLTILSGDDTCSTVVSVTDANDGTTVDGFVIDQGVSRGIYCDNADMNILNCLIADNIGDGIYISNSSPYISKCDIYDNAEDGIYATGSDPEIKNSLIHHNGDNGISLNGTASLAVIHNNTICYNTTGIDFNASSSPDISNCIIWGNDTDQINGATANYSCIEDPNATPSCEPDGSDNISADPCFAYDADMSYNFHLSPSSCCVDAGDNYFLETGETDIDGDDRAIDGDSDQTATVDMGADEVACSDVYHEDDFNGDGIINGDEFHIFATAWQSEPGDDPNDPNTPNWNSKCDFCEDNVIDMIDFCMFADMWLWQACYYNHSYLPMLLRTTGQDYTPLSMMESMSMESMSFASFSAESLLAAESSTLDTSDDDLTQDQLDRIWQRLRPPYNPSLGQRIIIQRDIIAWLKEIWYANDGIQEEIDEEEFWDFVDACQDELERMEEEYLQSLPVESE